MYNIGSREPAQASSNILLEKSKVRELRGKHHQRSVRRAYFLGQSGFAVCTGVNYNEKNIRLLEAHSIPD